MTLQCTQRKRYTIYNDRGHPFLKGGTRVLEESTAKRLSDMVVGV